MQIVKVILQMEKSNSFREKSLRTDYFTTILNIPTEREYCLDSVSKLFGRKTENLK